MTDQPTAAGYLADALAAARIRVANLEAMLDAHRRADELSGRHRDQLAAAGAAAVAALDAQAEASTMPGVVDQLAAAALAALACGDLDDARDAARAYLAGDLDDAALYRRLIAASGGP